MAVIDPRQDVLLHHAVELRQIDDHPGGLVRRSADGHVEPVGVPVAVEVVAFSEQLAVRVVTQCWLVQTVSCREGVASRQGDDLPGSLVHGWLISWCRGSLFCDEATSSPRARAIGAITRGVDRSARRGR